LISSQRLVSSSPLSGVVDVTTQVTFAFSTVLHTSSTRSLVPMTLLAVFTTTGGGESTMSVTDTVAVADTAPLVTVSVKV
jgi:hypothetical protein